MSPGLDQATTALANEIAALGEGQSSAAFHMSWWSERMMEWAMARPAFKTQLFRFVDVFPALTDTADVARHIEEYLGGEQVPPMLRTGIHAADRIPLGHLVEARVAQRNIERMARQFIVGDGPAAAVEGLHLLWQEGRAFTVDLLGEKTVESSEADRYAERVVDLLSTLAEAADGWTADPTLETDDLGVLPRVNVSIKPTALSPHFAPLTAGLGLAEAKERLRPVLRLAGSLGAFVYFDMEHYDVKDLSQTLFRDLLSEDDLVGVDAGIVVQAYLRDSYDDLRAIVDWSARRVAAGAKPVGVRLVKGAYWDAETVHARAEG